MKIAVCDDNRYFVNSILKKVKEYNIEDIFSSRYDGFVDSHKFMESFEKFEYDLVYLDVELKDENGMDVARNIRKIKPDCIIIFISSYRKYMNESYRVNAFQYLSKPINRKFFFEELERAVDTYREANKSILFRTFDGNKLIKVENIQYLETFYNKFKVMTTTMEHEGSIKKIGDSKKLVLEAGFFQLNRSIFINFNYIDRFTNEDVYMVSNDNFHITRRKRKEFKEKYFEFIAMK